MRRRVLLALLPIVVLGLVGLIGLDLWRQHDRVLRRVVVWGRDAGGLNRAELTGRLEQQTGEVLNRPLVVVAGAKRLSLTPVSAGIALDTTATISQALEAGRLQGPGGRVATALAVWRRPPPVEAVLTIQANRWESAADKVAVAVERLPRDAAVVLTGGEPTVKPAADGIALDREGLRRSMLRAVAAGTGEVEAALRPQPPKVSTSQAEAAASLAHRACASPVTLGYRERRFRLSPGDLASIAAVDPGGVEAGRPLTLATPAGRALLEKLLASLNVSPVDARLTVRPDGTGFDVVPGRDGTRVEWDGLFAALGRIVVTSGRRFVTVPVSPAHPRMSTQAAEQLRTRAEISSFTTYFSPSNEARAHNIQQVAQLLNGAVVEPGATFSFNETVGPRTTAAGFDEAPVIMDGRLKPGVGGGICQVSTTLFNAVFMAGLPVVERRAHSFYIDHYPVGRDATVSYGSTDFRFRNDSKDVLLILAAATDRSVRVSLVGPSWDRTVTYETGPFTHVVPPSSSVAEPRRLLDPDLPAGQTAPLEPGVNGCSVDVLRTVRGPGDEILLQDSFRSDYGPKDYVVRVGA